MAYKNLIFLVAIAVFLQISLADPVLIRRWESGGSSKEENEIHKNNPQASEETNYINEFATNPADRDRELIEVDIDTVAVPRFTEDDRIRFIHDFNENKTAIIDFSHQRCFVMELDQNRYSVPTSLFDLLWKMNTDYYAVDPEVIRENMRVVLPALDDLDDLGLAIKLNCEEFHTYMLVNVEGEFIFKRSIPTEVSIFREHVGKRRVLEFNIVNLNEVSEYEKRI